MSAPLTLDDVAEMRAFAGDARAGLLWRTEFRALWLIGCGDRLRRSDLFTDRVSQELVSQFLIGLGQELQREGLFLEPARTAHNLEHLAGVLEQQVRLR